MGWFDRWKKKAQEDYIKKQEEQKEREVAKAQMVGHELKVNPPDNVALERLEARLKRVDLSLATKFPPGHPRHKEFLKIKERLILEIKLKKGDY